MFSVPFGKYTTEFVPFLSGVAQPETIVTLETAAGLVKVACYGPQFRYERPQAGRQGGLFILGDQAQGYALAHATAP